MQSPTVVTTTTLPPSALQEQGPTSESQPSTCPGWNCLLWEITDAAMRNYVHTDEEVVMAMEEAVRDRYWDYDVIDDDFLLVWLQEDEKAEADAQAASFRL